MNDRFLLDQNSTPLISQIKHFVNNPDIPFYAPGHKQGRGISLELANLFGKNLFKADLPELPDLDNLFAPEGVIQEARELAAEAFGADETWFLVNGSTCGIVAAILAVCGPGDKIILQRNVHKSAIAGLILSGTIPVFLNPEYDPEIDLSLAITPESVEKALQQHPDTRAVFVVYPTYHGICDDLEAIARITDRYNIPLIVDEAHGAHFAFHEDLPPSALSLGADLAIQSTHKTLGALSQASMLHRRGNRIDAERINNALQLVETTSPSYLLLASLDGARKQMATEGRDLLSNTLELAGIARREIQKIPGLSVLDFPAPVAGCRWFDRTRLTVIVKGLGLTGYEVDDLLRERWNVTAELPSLQHITFLLSIGDRPDPIEKLVAALQELAGEFRGKNISSVISAPEIAASVLSPREAFFAPKETVSREQAVNRISAELICPYPPGIPVLLPGEIISIESLDYLQTVAGLGGTITGATDATLRTFRVVR
jgi:arginine/lysine/ornithine decarboxylase